MCVRLGWWKRWLVDSSCLGSSVVWLRVIRPIGVIGFKGQVCVPRCVLDFLEFLKRTESSPLALHTLKSQCLGACKFDRPRLIARGIVYKVSK